MPHGCWRCTFAIEEQDVPNVITTPAAVTAAIEVAFKALSDAGATVIDLDAAGFVFTPAAELSCIYTYFG
jgi:hypothetical protein